jgi:hypothetical protein
MTGIPGPPMLQMDFGAQQVAPDGQVIVPEVAVDGEIEQRPGYGQVIRWQELLFSTSALAWPARRWARVKARRREDKLRRGFDIAVPPRRSL